MGELVERAALKFAALALNEALENAKRAGWGIKYYPNGLVAIRTIFLDLDRVTKGAVMKIAGRYGLARHAAINLTKNKAERAIVIDLKKLNQVIHDDLGEIGESANWGLTLGGSPRKSTVAGATGGDPP